MKSKGSFFSGILTFFLVLIILGGVGFLGYNIIFKGNMSMPGMNMSSNTSKNSSGTMNMTNTDKTSTQTDTSKDSMNMNMNNNSSNNQMNMDNKTTQDTQNNYQLTQVNLVLANKDILDKALASINDATRLMTLDPYGVESKTQNTVNNTQTGTNNTQQPAATTTQGNATVNVYTAPNNQAMQSMGQTYDPSKMQQLHSGLYRLTVGMQLLSQLKDNVTAQVEQASINVKNPVQYYMNQYYITVQNKNKLTDAMSYINEAANLININPYLGPNGVVYDKDRMDQLHQSITKLADGVVGLNKLSDNMLKQSVQLGNLAQNYSNNSQMNNMNGMNMNSGGIFGNLSIGTIVTILLVVFAIVFILALLGSVMSLFKSPNTQVQGKEQLR